MTHIRSIERGSATAIAWSKGAAQRVLIAAAIGAMAAGAAFAQQPGPPGAPGPGAAGPRPPRGDNLQAPARVTPGVTKCATVADFLAYHNLPCAMTGGLPLPPASPQQLEKNKELVVRFYQGDWSVMDENFIQHDPAEPSTRKAWANFFRYRTPANSHPRPKVGGPMGYGDTPVDGRGSPVNYLVAEGDIVVAIRFRWWPWENGPEPIYKSSFVDIWRIKNGKLAEQWCSCTPEDATEKGIEQAKKDGTWIKFKNMEEQ